MKKLGKFAAILMAAVFVFGLSACGGGGANVDSSDYNYIFSQDIGTLNYLITNKTVDADAIAKTLDPLVLVDNYGALQPGLATSWTQSDDGLVWTFKLRQNVPWQKVDGSSYGVNVTAQDFVDAIEYILDPEMASLTVDFVTEFIEGADDYYNGEADFSAVGVKALDEYTLEYTTSGAYPFFASLMTYSCFLPINKQFVEEIGGIDNFGTGNDKYLYYGEYLFTTWERDQLWVFEKNPDYYFADRVHVNKLSYVFVEDASVALEMYKRGEISAVGLSSDKLDLALADPELSPYVYRTRPNSASWQFFFQVNTSSTPESENLKPALNNANFRKAVFSAINRTALLAVTNSREPEYMLRNTLNIWGLSTDDNGKDYMTYGNLSKYEADGFDFYNPSEAKTLFETAKAELGDSVSWPVTISFLTVAAETGIRRGEVLKQSVEDALGSENVIITLFEIPSSDYYAKQEEGAFDLTYSGWMPDYADPASYLEIYMSDGYLGARNYNFEMDGFDEFDRLMRDAKSKQDLAERYAGLAAAEEYLIDEGFVMPYSSSGGNYAINNIQNPYDNMWSVPYGLCNSMFKDVIYGDTPISAEEREAQKEAYEAKK